MSTFLLFAVLSAVVMFMAVMGMMSMVMRRGSQQAVQVVLEKRRKKK